MISLGFCLPEKKHFVWSLWPQFSSFSWRNLTVWKIKPRSTMFVDPCVKKQLIWLRTLGEEAFGVTLPKWKLPIIGTVAVWRVTQSLAGCEPIRLLLACYVAILNIISMHHSACHEMPHKHSRPGSPPCVVVCVYTQTTTHIPMDTADGTQRTQRTSLILAQFCIC